MALNLVVTCAYAGNFGWRHAQHTSSGPVGPGMLTLSAVSVAVLAVSGFLGGRLAYRYGFRVADETAQAEGYRTAGRPTGTAGPGARP